MVSRVAAALWQVGLEGRERSSERVAPRAVLIYFLQRSPSRLISVSK